MRSLSILLLISVIAFLPARAQNFTEILGRPTNNSVTISFLPDQPLEVYWEYGNSPSFYTYATPHFTAGVDSALEAEMTGLVPARFYFYRARYRAAGSTGSFLAGPEHQFHTQPPPGSIFTFAVEADPHLDTNSNAAAYNLTLQNMLSAKPDFLIDLGDIFMSEKQPVVNQATIKNRILLYRPYLGSVCHTVPLFLTIGNHEGENGWKIDGTDTCMPVLASNTRKKYYPNPFPGTFYSGNEKPEPYAGIRENYFAWTWGDALFIVLDTYWYTKAKNGWGWTLGRDQYEWFKTTLAESNARFKFIFCHQLVGGNGNDARGGSEFAGFFEQGGMNIDSTWGFDTNRPGWGKPLHQLMKEARATIYFHGHDHCYAMQEKDGIVYQEVPQPSTRNALNTTCTQYGYSEGTILPGRGYMLVTVTDTAVKADYIRTFLPAEETGGHVNGEIAYSYTIKYAPSAIEDRTLRPEMLQVGQNQPNPFRDETFLNYTLLAGARVTISIFDILGRTTATLDQSEQGPGTYSLKICSGREIPGAGIYFCRIQAGDVSRTLRIISVR